MALRKQHEHYVTSSVDVKLQHLRSDGDFFNDGLEKKRMCISPTYVNIFNDMTWTPGSICFLFKLHVHICTLTVGANLVFRKCFVADNRDTTLWPLPYI